jgi:hypothetical protein
MATENAAGYVDMVNIIMVVIGIIVSILLPVIGFIVVQLLKIPAVIDLKVEKRFDEIVCDKKESHALIFAKIDKLNDYCRTYENDLTKMKNEIEHMLTDCEKKHRWDGDERRR